MKTIDRFFLIAVFFLFYLELPAQSQYKSHDIVEAVATLGGRICNGNFNFSFDGSPYLADQFALGEIYYNGQDKFTAVPIRYNIFYDEMEYRELDKERIYALKPGEAFDKIIIPEDTFIVAQYKKLNEEKFGFFKIHECGKVSLLVKMDMEFKEAQGETTHEMAQPARFVRKSDEYYLKMPDQPAILIKNAKKMISSLNDHEEELETYQKTHKISGKKEEDLIRLVTYYNSL